jgi:type II secretory pathway component PulF
MTIETDRRTMRLMAAFEPLLIIMMFLFVGGIMLAFMIPMITMTSEGM